MACDRRTPALLLTTPMTQLATPAPTLTTHSLDAHHAARDPLTQPPRVHEQPQPVRSLYVMDSSVGDCGIISTLGSMETTQNQNPPNNTGDVKGKAKKGTEAASSELEPSKDAGKSLISDCWTCLEKIGIVDGKERCCAHILYLIVQDGLKVIGDALQKIRQSVKYVKVSESRTRLFFHCVGLVGNIDTSVGLKSDCVTKWNPTFHMLLQKKVSLQSSSLLVGTRKTLEVPLYAHRFEQHKRTKRTHSRGKTELNAYLEAEPKKILQTGRFDILSYWKDRSRAYSALSKMACDILSIPITTVVS